MSSVDVAARSARPRRRVYWDRAATAIALGLAAITVLMLWRLSHPSYGAGLVLVSIFPAYALELDWLVLVIASIIRRRIRVPVLVVPLVIAVLFGAAYTRYPAEIRWDLSRPSMDAYVRTLPAPPSALTRELSSAEDESYDLTFRSACPGVLGSYRVVGCRSIPGGYVFLTSADAGLAYLPGGEPEFGLPLSFMEEPYLEPLGSGWYRVFASW